MNTKDLVGKNIADLRKKNNLTQSQFAERINVTQGAVSQWETGRTSPDTLQLLQIAETFCVDVNLIVHGENWREIPIGNRHNLYQEIHAEMQKLSDDHLKQIHEYISFLRKLEEE